jgi:parallel beta-helix repeat protein
LISDKKPEFFKEIMRQNLIVLTVFFAISQLFAQTHFYVNGVTGNDSNPGTSVASSWKTIQKACNAATAGGIVHIAPGTYTESLEPHVSGTATNLITFKADLPETVFIDGTGTNFICLLRVENRSYLHFENLVFQNLTKNACNGVVVETLGNPSATGISFKNCIIRNIRWTANTNAQPDDSDNAHPFIAFGRNGGLTNLTLDGLQVYNNITGYSEALTLEGNISGFVVKNCTVRDNSNIGILISGQRGVSDVNDTVRNGTVSNNLCYNNINPNSMSGGIYVCGGSNVIIERNTCHTNGYGIEIGAEEDENTHDITVKNNILYNNQGGGVEVGGYNEDSAGIVTNCVIRNNTFYKNDTFNESVGELHITKVSNCVIQNNIFYTSAQRSLFSVHEIAPQSGISFHHNSWFSPGNNPANASVIWHHVEYNNFSTYQSQFSFDPYSTFSNPGFVSVTGTLDFHLTGNSPCINQGNGATVITADEKDFDGNNRIVGGVIDRGAIESGNALAVAPAALLECSLLPNPASTAVTLKLTENPDNGVVEFFDNLGRSVLTENVSQIETVLDVSRLPEGIYFVKITNGASQSTLKLLIER